MVSKKNNASSGHKLGQVIGDWYEQFFALPILKEVCDELGLYVDSRFNERQCRSTEKILWKDHDGNAVDYDFVIELEGSDVNTGIPVAFFETFWRRGARHSKDKARDDTGKLVPMRNTYPTARVIGILAAGDFIAPACEFVKTRNVDLFYVVKNKIISAWKHFGLSIDYPDDSAEDFKRSVTANVCNKLESEPDLYNKIAIKLRSLVGASEVNAYKQRIKGKLGAIPQAYTVYIQRVSLPIVFNNYTDLEMFLSQNEPAFDGISSVQSYKYEVMFGDGDCFYGDNLSWEELKERHNQLKRLVLHMEKLC